MIFDTTEPYTPTFGRSKNHIAARKVVKQKRDSDGKLVI